MEFSILTRTIYYSMNWSFLVVFVVCVLADQWDPEIGRVQLLLQSDGPSLATLSQFSNLISQIEHSDPSHASLPQLYFKKSLIQINLSREKDAVANLKQTLQLDPSLKPAQTKLVDLLIEFSRFDDPIFDTLNDGEVAEKIQNFKDAYSRMEDLFSRAEYPECKLVLESELLPISPLNSSLYTYYIDTLKHTQNESPEDSKLLIQAYSKLLKLDSVGNLLRFVDLLNYLLYTQVNFEKAFSTVKQCLRIDNEYKECVNLLKFFSRMLQFFTKLEMYSIELSHIYLETESDKPTIDLINVAAKVDFDQVELFLFENKPTARQLQGISGVNSNYDYVMHFYKKFAESQGLETTRFSNDLNKLICEACVHRGDLPRGKPFCTPVENEFFPKRIPDIDRLMSQNRYDTAEQLMRSFAINVRQTTEFQDRWRKIDSYLRQQAEQKRRQQYQRQQQYQQQRQRQYQQQRQAASGPKTDYYKVLGIAKDADEKTIKKAHRSQTLKYHPDKYKGNDLSAEEIETKMQEINQAYEVLSNAELRERYDRGDDPNDPMSGRGGSPFGSQFAGNANPFGGSQFEFKFGGDFFNGNGFNFGGFGNQHRAKFQRGWKKSG